MNFGQIEAVYHIVRSGTFGAAARELHVTQSALSHRVKALEEQIGSSLFVRGRRSVSLTPLGEEIATHAERIFEELLAIRKHFVRNGEVAQGGTLRVAATNIGTAYLYGEFFEGFIAGHPDVDLQILGAETTDDAIGRVQDRRADVAFTAYPVSTRDLEAVTLGEAEVVLIAGSAHPIAKLKRPDAAALRKWPFVRHLPGSPARIASDEVFLPAGGYPRILTESSDTEYVKRIVSLGLGLSFVALFTILRELKAGTLCARRVRGHVLMQPFGLMYRKGARPALVDRFVSICRDICRKSPLRYALNSVGRARRSRGS